MRLIDLRAERRANAHALCMRNAQAITRIRSMHACVDSYFQISVKNMALTFLSWFFGILIFLSVESRGEYSIATYMVVQYSISLSLKPFLSQACNVNSIRLAGGQTRFEGRVEVCHNGQWKRVCVYGWYGEEANVVCRQLGFSGNLSRKKQKKYACNLL